MNQVFDHRNGILATLLIHGFFILLLVFFGFRTPLPLPPEQGMLVNFGNSDNGSGLMEPEDNAPAKNAAAPVEETKEEQKLTQDFEEAPAIEKKKEQPHKEVKKLPEKKTVPVQKVQPVVETPKVNTKALYTGKKTDGGTGNSQGITSGTGNQGVENGSPNAPNYGPGGGTGNSGVSFTLAGRSPLSLPKPEYRSQEQGKVVVDVTVDKEGNVITAQAGAKGTTTSAPSLWEAARKAALAAKFDRKPDAAATQKGTISYVFVLQ